MSFMRKLLRLDKKAVTNVPTKEDRIFYNWGSFSHQDFAAVPAAIRAGMTIAAGMGQKKIVLEGPDNDQKRKLESLLNREPNPIHTGVEFREMLTLYAVFKGTARAFIVRRASTREPKEIWPLHPTWIADGWQRDDDGYFLPVSLDDGRSWDRVERDDLIEISTPRWDYGSGIDVSRACCRVLGLSTNIQTRQARLSDTNAPFGVLTTPEGVSTDLVKKLRLAWEKQFGKTGIALVDFDAKFTQMMQTAADQQLLETAQYNVEDVARMYGVHPFFLMKTDGMSAQGAISDVMTFNQMVTMAPWVNRWDAALERSILRNTAFTAKFDEKWTLQTTPENRAHIDATSLGSGGGVAWKSVNEVRSDWGLEPIAGGDELPKPAAAPKTAESAEDT